MSKNPENPNRFTPDETSTFKCLFSKFCRQQINEENCTDDDCVTCCVNEAEPQRVAFFGGDGRKIGADEYWDDRAVCIA